MKLSIGVDIGGTKIAFGIVNQSGDVLYRFSIPTPNDGKNSVIRQLKEGIDACIEYANAHHLGQIVGVGVGTAGQIDFDNGRVLSGTTNIHDWNHVPLRDELVKHTSLPIWVENDVNVVALAEKYLGVAQGEENVICLALGTGVGGGIIAHNQLIRGAIGAGAELGHVSVDMNGPVCNCGFRGCLEVYASGTGIARMMRELLAMKEYETSLGVSLYQQDPGLITSHHVFEWSKKGDQAATKVIEGMIHALSFAIVNFIHTFNPTMVILGGGVMENGDWICDAVGKKVGTLGLRSLVDPVKIKKAKLGSDAGLIGAAYQTWLYGA